MDRVGTLFVLSVQSPSVLLLSCRGAWSAEHVFRCLMVSFSWALRELGQFSGIVLLCRPPDCLNGRDHTLSMMGKLSITGL